MHASADERGEGSGGRQPPPHEPQDMIQVARTLHDLALRYWSEGREDDARRVALEAADLLAAAGPDSALMRQVTSILEGLSPAPEAP